MQAGNSPLHKGRFKLIMVLRSRHLAASDSGCKSQSDQQSALGPWQVPHGTMTQPVPLGQQLATAPLSPQHFSHRCAAGGSIPMELELPSPSP